MIRAIELDPGSAEAYEERGYAYIRLENYEEGLADLEKAIEIDPDFAEAHNTLHTFVTVGDWPKLRFTPKTCRVLETRQV